MSVAKKSNRSAFARIVTTLVVVALPPAAAPPAAAAQATSFETAGSCTEAAAFVPVDADVARRHLPPGFVLQETAGTARLTVFSERCRVSVDAGAPSTTVIGGAQLITDPAASRARCGSHALYWTASEDDDYLRAYRDIGWLTPLDREGRFAVTGVGPGAIVTAHNRNDSGSFDLHLVGTAAPQLVEPIPITSVHCHVGPRGLVKGVFPHDFFTVGAHSATLEVDPGSLLWTLVGEREVVTAPALFGEFDFTGTTAVVAE